MYLFLEFELGKSEELNNQRMKELLEFFLLPKTNKKADKLFMEFSRNPNTKYTELPQSSISTDPFYEFRSFPKTSQPIG